MAPDNKAVPVLCMVLLYVSLHFGRSVVALLPIDAEQSLLLGLRHFILALAVSLAVGIYWRRRASRPPDVSSTGPDLPGPDPPRPGLPHWTAFAFLALAALALTGHAKGPFVGAL